MRPLPSLQIGWLRASKTDEQEGLDLTQGVGSGLGGTCFPCLPFFRD